MADLSLRIHGSGFNMLLALLFITLRLVGVVHWSWWLVLAPLWAPFALIGGVFLVCSLLVGAITLIDEGRLARKREAAKRAVRAGGA